MCQEFVTGEMVWNERTTLRAGSLTSAEGRIYCFSEDNGTVVLLEASPDRWRESGRFRLPQLSTARKPSGRIWTPPVLSGGRLFLREQELLFCYDLRAK